MRLVVVDDDPDIRLLLNIALPRAGFEVVGEAVDGADAIGVVNSAQPDGVVLDMMMPVMDGLTALPAIKRAAPQARVVLYSSVDIDLIRKEALLLGAHRVLAKTAGTAALVAALRSEVSETLTTVELAPRL